MNEIKHTCQGAEEQLSYTIVDEVVTATGDEAAELPPLYETIDPDALEAFIDSSPADTSVRFRYHGFVVTVTGDGTVALIEER